MVNEIILEYLRSGVPNFPIEDLRSNILAKGYSLEEIEEAIKLLEGDKTIKFFKKKDLFKDSSEDITYKGFKWMKFSSIIGFFFFGIFLFLFAFSLFESSLSQTLLVIFFFFFCVSSVFYFFGFYKLGKFEKSRMISYSSIIQIFIFVILGCLVLLGYFLFFKEFSFKDILLDFSLISGRSYLFIFSSFFFFLILILRVCFSGGLILSGEKIRFSFFAGILGVILSTLILAIFSYSIYLIFNPDSLESLILNPSSQVFLGSFYYVLVFLILFSLFFESLTLRDGSLNYEN